MKSRKIIIIAIMILLISVSVFFYMDYSSKRNGKTFESRELILQEKYDADYLICEEKIDGYIFSGFELANGRTGLATFKEDNGKFKATMCKYADDNVPAVRMEILNGKYCYLIFLNQPNMKRVEVTYVVTNYLGTEENITINYDITDHKIICSERPQKHSGQPIEIVYYDIKGNKHRFIEHPEMRDVYIKNN